MKIMITGANGFIGTYLCRECEKREIDFLPLCNGREYPSFGNRAREFDLDDCSQLQEYIQEYRPDVIVHLAAIASPVYGDSTAIYRVNVIGSENLLKAASTLDYKCKVILISTAGVYGNQSVPALTEDLPFNPVNHYSCSKMVMEVISRQYADKLDIHIVRPFNIIGSGQTQAFLIPKLIKHFAEKLPEIRMGNLDAVRDYVSVEYCVNVILTLATTEEQAPPILNICSGTGHSCRQLIEILKEITGHSPEIICDEEFVRTNEIWSLVGDNTKLNGFMGCIQEAEPVADILRRMLG